MNFSNPDYLFYRAKSGKIYLIKRENLITRKAAKRGFFIGNFKVRHRNGGK